MSATMPDSARMTRDGADGLGYELGRYTVPAGARVLCGRRVNNVAIVIDAPLGSEGRVYLVERDVEPDGYFALRALITVTWRPRGPPAGSPWPRASKCERYRIGCKADASTTEMRPNSTRGTAPELRTDRHSSVQSFAR